MSTFTPTDEQIAVLEAFRTGKSLVIEAGAGTGKTSTLRLIAESTDLDGQYIAFNKAVVQDADDAMPWNVKCNTAHSLAFRAVGRRFKNRLNSSRQSNEQIASLIGVEAIVVPMPNETTKRLAAGFLAGQVMKAISNFCTTADPEPGFWHFSYIDGIDPPTEDGKRTYENNNLVRNELLIPLARAWADLQKDDRNPGRLRFSHDIYLKLWQLSKPVIRADFIMFDECQDASPVMLDVVGRQECQRVYVGDSQQQIYEFTGAINALAKVDVDQRCFLTQSFRFGDAVAEKANEVLGLIPEADIRLRGLSHIPSTIARVPAPVAVLARTNAAAVEYVLEALMVGRRPALVGGTDEVVRFAEAAAKLQAGQSTSHPELACFDSWDEVQRYVTEDGPGRELKLLVRLIDKFSARRIISDLRRTVKEKDADVIVSTAHKSKGREWDTVRLAGDFPDFTAPGVALEPGELRLLYVAVTRAKLTLDLAHIPLLNPEPEPDPELDEDEDELVDA